MKESNGIYNYDYIIGNDITLYQSDSHDYYLLLYICIYMYTWYKMCGDW